jgi:Tfp pilus assembly protein PilF
MSKPSPAELNGQVHPARNRRTVIGFGLIAFAVLITYGNTLKSEFIHDDTAEILQNPFVRDLSHIHEIFTSAAWTFGGAGPYQLSSNYYRPIQYLTYALLYRFFGPEPWGYHLYKLLSHLAVCGLVFWILWRWWQDYHVALFSSLLFAVHPANTEAVSWVSGITDTTCALFFLLSLLVYLEDRSQPSNLRLFLLSFLFLLGMLSKETMVTFLGVILVYEWLETGRFPKLKNQARVFIPLLSVFVVYLGLRINAIGAFTNPRQVQFRFDVLNQFQILLNQIILLSKYLALFFFPVKLNAHHLYDPVTSPFSYRFGFAFLVLIASLLGIRLMLKSMKPERRGLLLVGSVWFPIVLLPVIVFFKQLGENVFAERYIYLPSIGLCISVCLVLTLAKGWRLKTSSVAFGMLVTVLASMSIERNKVWQTELSFYETTAKASPREWGILNNLGAAYNKRGRPQDAIKAFEASITVQPSPHALKNLGYSYAAVGRTEDSETTYRKAIALDPMDAGAYAALADALSARGRYSEAIRNYERALALYPASTVALFSYAEACLADHRYDEAIRALQRILALSPAESARAYGVLARVYQAQNLPELAAEAKRKASAGVTVQLFR